MVKFFHNNRQEETGLSILDAIELAKNDLDCAYTNFEHAVEPDLIDCYIYEVNSALKRYRFLLQQAERMKLCEEYHEDSPTNVYDEAVLVNSTLNTVSPCNTIV